MPLKVDVLIVGAGFAGMVAAERLANVHGLRCLVVDKRSHLGGNSHDQIDEAGVRIHCYGPHYFRTNSDKVVGYLSNFTEWLPANYQILSYTDGQFWNFPINLNTFEQLIGRSSSEEEFRQYLEKNRVPIEHPANSEEVIIAQVGWELYEKFFLGYTLKQWQRHPRELDASVCGRIPIRTNRDNHYLSEKFQAIPKDGYTSMFDRMLASCSDRVELRLNTEYRDILDSVEYRHMVYTGPLDEFFDYQLGHLPYRSLRFERESFTPQQLQERVAISGRSGLWQPAVQVNYPNEEAFTRIVEIKHVTQQVCENTTIVREYPESGGPGKEPFYPVPNPQTHELRRRYLELAGSKEDVSFIGRLATYRYYNMDQVVALALQHSEELGRRLTDPGRISPVSRR